MKKDLKELIFKTRFSNDCKLRKKGDLLGNHEKLIFGHEYDIGGQII